MGIGSSSKSSGSVKSFTRFQFDGQMCGYHRHGSSLFLESIFKDPKKSIDHSVITKIEIWKVPLVEWFPFDFGLFYHAFLVFETKTGVTTDANLRWSFEKDAEKISLQYSSIHGNDVIEKFGRNKRLPRGLWKPQKLVEYKLKQEMPMENIFSVYLDTENSKYYNFITKNCQDFAQDIFNDMISKKYKSFCKACGRGFGSYVRDMLSRPVGFIANICIRLQIIGFCYLNSMFATMYWSLFITELTCLYGSHSKF